jgi:predicted ATPase
MLQKLRLCDFKSFADQIVELGRTTFLVGANASGKSNFFDALRFLHGICRGDLSVSEVLNGGWEGEREMWPGIRGGVAECARSGTHGFRIESFWLRGGHHIEHAITCDLRGEPSITEESLRVDGDLLWLARDGMVQLKRADGSRTSHPRSATRSMLGQVVAAAELDRRIEEVAFWQIPRSLVALDLRPAEMRHHVQAQARSIGHDGRFLSAVLKRLVADADQKRDLLDWLSEFCAPAITDIEFDETTRLREVMLVLAETTGTRVSARSLSDGTLRFLGELVALLSAPDDSILLLEEIENGLHPARIHLLVELIEALTQTGNRQVIATTHSPLALAALSDAALEKSVVFAHPGNASGSIMRNLGELPHFREVKERRGVDYLFTTQWLERAL